MTGRILLLMLLLQDIGATRPQGPPPREGIIEGVVLAAGTNQPIEEAGVILAGKGDAARSSEDSFVRTDRQGRFVFKDLDAGTYRLAFESDGHVRQEYGQRTFPGSGTPVQLAAGQELRNLVVRMTATAALSGRILDEDRQPLAGVPIRLMRSSYSKDGERSLETYGTAQTDDRGEYRLFFVTPGRYYVHAGTAQPHGCCGPMKPSQNNAPTAFASRYYPGVADLQSAMTLDVKAGSEINGIDWTVARQQLFKIRGRVIDTETGQSPNYVELWLRTADSMYPVGQFGGDKGTYANGIFEFRDLVPGPYRLSGEARPSRGSLSLDVHSDIDNLVLYVSPSRSLSGRVSTDDAAATVAAFFDTLFKERTGSRWLTVSLSGTDSVVPGWTRLDDNSDPDGAFSIVNVLPGEYGVHFWFTPEVSSFYVKEARFGATDVLHRPLQFTRQESESNTLNIVLSSKVGTLNGSVTLGQQPAAGAQVVLVPDRFRNRSELFRDVHANQDGRFIIPNVAPGDYKVFAWEAIEPYSWFDPQVLQRAESRAISLHVAELSLQSIELTAIAAAQ